MKVKRLTESFIALFKRLGYHEISESLLMSEEQFKAFLEKAKGDTNLQAKLKAAADVDAVLAIAKDAGFMISADELKAFSELSVEELENVAGGGTDVNHCYFATAYGPHTCSGACAQ